MHLIMQKLKAYVPLSQSCPVQPLVHEQVFGATQCPPFWHGELQIATVIQSDNIRMDHNLAVVHSFTNQFGSVLLSILMYSCMSPLQCTRLHFHRVDCIQLYIK